MSTWVLCWLAAGVAFASVIVLVAADQVQVAMQRRRPPGGPGLLRRMRPAAPPDEPEWVVPRGPMLVRLEPRTPWWRRIVAAVETVLLAAAVGFSLALALGIALFAGAFLLRQAVG